MTELQEKTVRNLNKLTLKQRKELVEEMKHQAKQLMEAFGLIGHK